MVCLRHVLERLREMFLAEWKLADSPDFGVRLQVLLDLHIKGAGLKGDDLRGSFWVVGNRGAAFRTENPVNCFA